MQFNLSLVKPSPNLISVAGEWLFSVNRKTREKTMKRMKKKKRKKCKKPETKKFVLQRIRRLSLAGNFFFRKLF